MKTAISAALCAASLILAASAASASTVTLQTTADGSVSNGSAPTPPVGVFTNLQTITATRFSPGFDSFAIFEFDLSAIDDTSTIDSATFGYVNGSSGAALGGFASYSVEAYLGDGAINVADFSTSGVIVGNGQVAVGLGVIGLADSIVLNLNPIFQSALSGNLLTLRIGTTVQGQQIQFASLESNYANATLTLGATAAPPPNPSAVPLPAGLPLLLAGLGAFGLVRRGRRTTA